jgi:anion-transporting  ArsA/GET3 family ATPase
MTAPCGPPVNPCPAFIDDFLQRRVILVLGKGGVGRTSVAAAIAHCAAARGMRALIMETDSRAPIAAAYGHESNFRPKELASHLWAMLLERQASLEEYLSFVVARPILRAVFASSLYQYFVHAAPAVRELLMVGKIYHEVERRPVSLPRWDLLVVDLPASGQSLSMLGMPFAARETFGDNLVGREALEVGRFLRDPAKCAMLVVTSADHLALTETLEIHRRLAKLAIKTGGIIFNRTSASTFEEADIAMTFGKMSAHGSSPTFANLIAMARAELQRRQRDRRAFGLLKRQVGVPVVRLTEERETSVIALATRLAAQLESGARRG